jgi:hypothetical protein
MFEGFLVQLLLFGSVSLTYYEHGQLQHMNSNVVDGVHRMVLLMLLPVFLCCHDGSGRGTYKEHVLLLCCICCICCIWSFAGLVPQVHLVEVRPFMRQQQCLLLLLLMLVLALPLLLMHLRLL